MLNQELFYRILSSLILIPLSFFLIYKGNFYFNLFLFLILIISIKEWISLSYNKFNLILGIIFLIFSFFSAYMIRSFYQTLENLRVNPARESMFILLGNLCVLILVLV